MWLRRSLPVSRARTLASVLVPHFGARFFSTGFRRWTALELRALYMSSINLGGFRWPANFRFPPLAGSVWAGGACFDARPASCGVLRRRCQAGCRGACVRVGVALPLTFSCVAWYSSFCMSMFGPSFFFGVFSWCFLEYQMQSVCMCVCVCVFADSGCSYVR